MKLILISAALILIVGCDMPCNGYKRAQIQGYEDCLNSVSGYTTLSEAINAAVVEYLSDE